MSNDDFISFMQTNRAYRWIGIELILFTPIFIRTKGIGSKKVYYESIISQRTLLPYLWSKNFGVDTDAMREIYQKRKKQFGFVHDDEKKMGMIVTNGGALNHWYYAHLRCFHQAYKLVYPQVSEEQLMHIIHRMNETIASTKKKKTRGTQ